MLLDVKRVIDFIAMNPIAWGMLVRSQIALNRITYPHVDLQTFLKITADLDLGFVEIRNDLPGKEVCDDLSPEEVTDLCTRLGVRIASINALQRFNLVDNLQQSTEELKTLAGLAKAIACPAVVLCPNNDREDSRSEDQKFEETVRCLQALAPILQDASVLGYVEPLGFKQSSQRSLLSVQETIRQAGIPCYRIVYDTFHSFLGPDTPRLLEEDLNVESIGLVHTSGVEQKLDADQYRDEQRGFITDADRFGNVEQIGLLLKMGYSGLVSLELFSPEVQNLPLMKFVEAVSRCVDFLLDSCRI